MESWEYHVKRLSLRAGAGGWGTASEAVHPSLVANIGPIRWENCTIPSMGRRSKDILSV